MKTVRFVMCLLGVWLFASMAVGAPLYCGTSDSESRVVINYDPQFGSLRMHAPEGQSVSGFSLKSAGGLFNIDNIADPGQFTGLFDVVREDQLFKLSPPPNDFSSLYYGRVYPTGRSQAEVLADLDASGSMVPSGKAEELGDPPGVLLFSCWIPEPSSLTLAFCGLLGLMQLRRR